MPLSTLQLSFSRQNHWEFVGIQTESLGFQFVASQFDRLGPKKPSSQWITKFTLPHKQTPQPQRRKTLFYYFLCTHIPFRSTSLMCSSSTVNHSPSLSFASASFSPWSGITPCTFHQCVHSPHEKPKPSDWPRLPTVLSDWGQKAGLHFSLQIEFTKHIDQTEAISRSVCTVRESFDDLLVTLRSQASHWKNPNTATWPGPEAGKDP